MCSLAVRICVILMSITVINASNSGASLQILKHIGQSAIANLQQTIKSNIRAKINNVRTQIFSVSNSVSAQSSSSSSHPEVDESPVLQHGYNEFNSYYDYDLSKFGGHNAGSYSYESPSYYYEHPPHSYQDFDFNTIPKYHH
ncbi:hypothetical protein O3M35_003244 [Rhynocoris fuscipes]|uniref:Uncharacterized protein n=1 Tax=Rhynocoris fuscipes TaxID=488301 RepID=A0AAW1CJF5_9HEMI